ncbi:MAG: hypothetical protein RR382_12965 [Tannerellaceae bacterium]
MPKPTTIASVIQAVTVVMFYVSYFMFDNFMGTSLLAISFMAWGFYLGWRKREKKGGA